MIQNPQMIPAWVDGALVPLDKLDVHHRGIKHRAVSVFVMAGDQILLQRRALGKYHTPGLWANTCCTHPLWGEAPRDCAQRRLEEELGITGLDPVWKQEVEYRAEVGGGMTEHEVVDLFVAEAPADLKFAANPDEVMETVWMSRKALEANIAARPEAYTPWLRIYMADHPATIFG
ncbi:MAG TPA: isopentenyl-diphosphate Delta-isomerase [Paracoccaceae bacterium]|nr:isopentenyl-diphosphate Delta-isomerase [Paracoccaceae bacterium]